MREARMNQPPYVGVIGAGSCPEKIYQMAMDLGTSIARKGWILVCGGLGGVMAAAARGCHEAGGMAVGLLPGLDRAPANPYLRVALPTGLGEGRNLLVVRASDLLIAVSGGYGTLSEIALGLKTGKPVIGLETWPAIEGIVYVSSPQGAMEAAERLLNL
jgi:uncharacterized protein (TIGR00725 family)